MDLSALIFVALAVAWAVYLIPKALKHHDDVVRSRSVDRFSHTMRVLARREPVSRKNARLVVTPGRAATAPVVTTKHTESAAERQQAPMERKATNRAARRRRRVLGLILLANAAVIGVAAFSLISWWYAALPGGLLLGWLVACRLMVRSERGIRRPADRAVARVADVEDEGRMPVETDDEDDDDLHNTTQTPAIADPSLWDPMPVTLPTYVTKPAAARRSVRTIDLDSTGVWTSGRTDGDAQIARDADEAARYERAELADRKRDDGSRAVGS